MTERKYVAHLQAVHGDETHVAEAAERLLDNHAPAAAHDPHLVLRVVAETLQDARHRRAGRTLQHALEVVLQVAVEALLGLQRTAVVQNEEARGCALIDFLHPRVLSLILGRDSYLQVLRQRIHVIVRQRHVAVDAGDLNGVFGRAVQQVLDHVRAPQSLLALHDVVDVARLPQLHLALAHLHRLLELSHDAVDIPRIHAQRTIQELVGVGKLADDHHAARLLARHQKLLRMQVQALRQRRVQIDAGDAPESHALVDGEEGARQHLEVHAAGELGIAGVRSLLDLQLVGLLLSEQRAATTIADLDENQTRTVGWELLQEFVERLNLVANGVGLVELVNARNHQTVRVALEILFVVVVNHTALENRLHVLCMKEAKDCYLSVESHVRYIHANAARAPLQTEIAVRLDALADAEMAAARRNDMSRAAVGVGADQIARENSAQNGRAERKLAENLVGGEGHVQEEDDLHLDLGALRHFLVLFLQITLPARSDPVVVHHRILAAHCVELLPSVPSSKPTRSRSSSISSSKLSTNAGPGLNRDSGSESDAKESLDGRRSVSTGESEEKGDTVMSFVGERTDADDANEPLV